MNHWEHFIDQLLPVSVKAGFMARRTIDQLTSLDDQYNLQNHFSNQVIWCGKKKEKSKRVIVYFPGFTAGNGEAITLLESISKELRSNILITRIGSSGVGPELTYFPAELWLAEAEAAIHTASLLGDEIQLMGASTGASICLYLHQQFPDYFHRIILSSANLGVTNKLTELLAIPVAGDLLLYALGNEQVRFTSENPYQAEHWLRVFELKQFAEVMKIVKMIRQNSLKSSQKIYWQWHLQDSVVDTNLLQSYLHAHSASSPFSEVNYQLTDSGNHNLLTAEFYSLDSQFKEMQSKIMSHLG